MTSHFISSVKQTSNELITISTLLDKKMETWAKALTRHPDSQNVGICAGFISKDNTVNRIELEIDVLTPPKEDSGLVRTRAIETIHDENGNERFNNVSLQYEVDRASAQRLVKKGESITREDIKQLLQSDSSRVGGLVISDRTGKDDKSKQLLGKRYDLDIDELDAMSEDSEKEILDVMNTVLKRIKQTAASEAK